MVENNWLRKEKDMARACQNKNIKKAIKGYNIKTMDKNKYEKTIVFIEKISNNK